ncbi:MAG TPA: Gfo/Idh/MocA family oxidoreductase [Gemmataceae bacterium]|nr:Gfo/Idh/MocA family oxidoreductase [Gemmataceae bacterium]
MKRLRMGVVGVGHLGKEHARILSNLPEVELVGVADPHNAQAEAVALRCNTRPYAGHTALLSLVDAVVIAAPTFAHHGVASDFLSRGVAVLVEKPLTADPAQAEELVALAERCGVLLQVGHIERFNPAFEAMHRLPLQPKYIHAERCSGFSGRSTDVGVVHDLMIHDLDLIRALVHSRVRSVEALGAAVLGGCEDLAQARITFADGCVADVRASRVHPTAVRRMQVWAPEGFVGADLAARKLTLTQPALHLRHGRMDSRRLDTASAASLKAELFGRHLQVREVECTAVGDQLTRELQEFVQCVRSGSRPRVDGKAGRDAVELAGRVLEAMAAHRWNGTANGPVGPWQLPTPLGMLFSDEAREAA